jgi:hypothetical protein
MFTFVPQDFKTTLPTVTFGTTAFAHREIVDLRESSEVTIKIPFVSDTPWRDVLSVGAPTGVLFVHVADALTAPAVVSSTINCLVEISGGPDIEFAVPTKNANAMALNVTPQMGVFSKQGNPPCEVVDTSIGISSTTFDPTINAIACIGEKITSFRALMKSMSLVNRNGLPDVPAKILAMWPYSINVHYDGLASPYPAYVGDIYSSLGSVFALSRGGMRVKYQLPASTFTDFPAVTTLSRLSLFGTYVPSAMATLTNNMMDATTNIAAARVGSLGLMHHTAQNLGVEVSIPQYNINHSRANADNVVNTNVPLFFGTQSLADRNNLTICIPGTTTLPSGMLYRAPSDDGDFGYFVSVPPMQTSRGSTGPY